MICVAVAKIRKNLSLPFLTKEIFIFINAIFKQRHEQEMFYNLTDNTADYFSRDFVYP